ncbi:MAG: hypothetical protein II868_07210, partial [Butyrivibrio sp.]|nr:hypothetical protein [Butyrivibrio sp.]
MGIEIERKFLVKEVPKDYGQSIMIAIEQGYLNVSPAIRVRRQGDQYFLTYKGEHTAEDGDDNRIGHTEYNLP